MAIETAGSLIIITREEIGERYKPAGRLFDLCSAGRLLMISTGEEARELRMSRREAVEMNGMAEEIAKEDGR